MVPPQTPKTTSQIHHRSNRRRSEDEMTVNELIAKLLEFPPNMPIKIYGGLEGGDLVELEEVHLDAENGYLVISE